MKPFEFDLSLSTLQTWLRDLLWRVQTHDHDIRELKMEMNILKNQEESRSRVLRKVGE